MHFNNSDIATKHECMAVIFCVFYAGFLQLGTKDSLVKAIFMNKIVVFLG